TVGFVSDPQSMIISNCGTADLIISNVVITGNDFILASNTCAGATLTRGGTNCTVSIQFAPTATGQRSGEVIIANNAADSPQVITLIGTGIPPAPLVCSAQL